MDAGATVAGYRLVRLVGRGGSCEVFLGRPAHRAPGPDGRTETVAVKIVPAPERSRGEAEVLALQAVASDHVVGLVDVATLADGGLCVVQSIASRGTAASLVARRGGLTPGETVTLVASVLRGLGDLHEAGFAHGALDLGHVLIDASGRPLLCGLGSSRPTSGRDEGAGRGGADPVEQDLVRVARIAQALRDPAVGHPRASDERWDEWEDLLDAVIHGESDLTAHELADRLLGVADAAPLAEPSVPAHQPMDDEVRFVDSGRLLPGLPHRTVDGEPRRACGPRPHDGSGDARVRRHRAVRDRGGRRGSARLRALRGALHRELAAVRPRMWVLGGAALVLLAVGAAALPTMASSARGGYADPEGGNGEPTAPVSASDTTDAAAETAPSDAGADAHDADATAGDDPAPAAAALLRIRAACVDAGDVTCLARADQPGSAADDADRALIATGGGGDAASSHAHDLMGDAQRMGDTALVQLRPETGAADSDASDVPGAVRRPASLLIIRGEAGWRIRDLMDDR